MIKYLFIYFPLFPVLSKPLDFRTQMYESVAMDGNELLKKIKKLAKRKNKHLELFRAHGKGSHSTLKFGDKKTIIKDLKKEIGPGLLSKMLKQLEIDKDEL